MDTEKRQVAAKDAAEKRRILITPTTVYTDQEWIRQLKQDDDQAIRHLWEMLFTYGVNLARYKGQLDDFGHDAAIAAYKRVRTKGIYQYRFQCPFPGYCRRIVVNEFRRRLSQQPPPTQPLQEELVGNPSLPEDVPQALREHLQPCLEKLRARERQIINSLYFHQLDPQLIAEQLGIRRNHVNQLAFRARRQLRDCLQARGFHSIEDLL